MEDAVGDNLVEELLVDERHEHAEEGHDEGRHGEGKEGRGGHHPAGIEQQVAAFERLGGQGGVEGEGIGFHLFHQFRIDFPSFACGIDAGVAEEPFPGDEEQHVALVVLSEFGRDGHLPPGAFQLDAALHDAAWAEYLFELLVGGEETVVVELVILHLQIVEQQVQHTVVRTHGNPPVHPESHVARRLCKDLSEGGRLLLFSFVYLVVE